MTFPGSCVRKDGEKLQRVDLLQGPVHLPAQPVAYGPYLEGPLLVLQDHGQPLAGSERVVVGRHGATRVRPEVADRVAHRRHLEERAVHVVGRRAPDGEEVAVVVLVAPQELPQLRVAEEHLVRPLLQAAPAAQVGPVLLRGVVEGRLGQAEGLAEHTVPHLARDADLPERAPHPFAVAEPGSRLERRLPPISITMGFCRDSRAPSPPQPSESGVESPSPPESPE